MKLQDYDVLIYIATHYEVAMKSQHFRLISINWGNYSIIGRLMHDVRESL